MKGRVIKMVCVAYGYECDEKCITTMAPLRRLPSEIHPSEIPRPPPDIPEPLL